MRQHARAIAFNPPRHASQDIRERYNIPRMNIIVYRCVYKDTRMYVCVCRRVIRLDRAGRTWITFLLLVKLDYSSKSANPFEI